LLRVSHSAIILKDKLFLRVITIEKLPHSSLNNSLLLSLKVSILLLLLLCLYVHQHLLLFHVLVIFLGSIVNLLTPLPRHSDSLNSRTSPQHHGLAHKHIVCRIHFLIALWRHQNIPVYCEYFLLLLRQHHPLVGIICLV